MASSVNRYSVCARYALPAVLGVYALFMLQIVFSRTLEHVIVAVAALTCMGIAYAQGVKVCRSDKKQSLLILLAIFVLSVLFSSIVSPVPIKSMARAIFFVIILLFIVHQVSRYETLIDFPRFFFIILVVSIFLMQILWPWISGEGIRIIEGGRLSLRINANAFAMILYVVLMLMVFLPQRAWKLPSIAVILFLIFLTGSRATFLAAAMALLAYAGLMFFHVERHVKRKIFVITLSLFLVVSVVYWILGYIYNFYDVFARLGGTTSIQARLSIWKFMWEVIKENWLFGVGYGVHDATLEDATLAGVNITPPSAGVGIPFAHAHNEFLAILAEIGVIGFVAYVLLLGRGLLVFYRAARSAEGDTAFYAAGFAYLVGYITLGMAETFHMHWGSLMWMVHWILLARSLYMPANAAPLRPCSNT